MNDKKMNAGDSLKQDTSLSNVDNTDTTSNAEQIKQIAEDTNLANDTEEIRQLYLADETEHASGANDSASHKGEVPSDKKSTSTRPKKKQSIGRRILKIFLGLTIFAIFASILGGFFIYQWAAKDLPSFSKIADYKPSLVTTVLARDGSVIGEFYNERRYLVSLQDVPNYMHLAVLATEDSDFYEHPGINLRAIARAFLANLKSGDISQGGSTITQQVVKRLMLTPERSYERKIKEAILAIRLETQLSKDDILTIYLNQIYYGNGAFGVEAAARTFFAKNAKDLTLAESALIAGLPQAPTAYNPYRNPQKAIERQQHVLRRMLSLGWIDDQAYEQAIYEELNFSSMPITNLGDEVDWYMEEVRRQFSLIFNEEDFDQFGFDFGVEREELIYEMGLTIHTSMDPIHQKAAYDSLRQGLEEATKRHGWLGPLENIESSERGEWIATQAFKPKMLENGKWVKALVTSVNEKGASVYLGRHENFTFDGFVDVSTMTWAREPNKTISGRSVPERQKIKDATTLLAEGDIIWVSLAPEELRPKNFDILMLNLKVDRLLAQLKNNEPFDSANLAELTALTGITDHKKLADLSSLSTLAVTSIPLALEQWPDVEGAIVSIEPKTGDVVAIVGGYQFGDAGSFFNRATQAKRQTGSSFKPFVYSAAIDNGFTAASMILDAPIVLTDPHTKEVWRPGNYEDTFVGYVPLYLALARSRNLCTVRIVQEMGIDKLVQRTSAFNMDTELFPSLSLSLGTAEVSPIEITQAYTAFANQGIVTTGRIIQKIEGSWGNIIYEEEPSQFQAISKQNAYIVANLLQGAVNFGTGWRARQLNYNVAAKTGTTNAENDAWFIAFTPNLVTTIYIGYDQMQPMGFNETGSGAAAPIYAYYGSKALPLYPLENFVAPEGISFVSIDGKKIPFYTGTEPTLAEIRELEQSIDPEGYKNLEEGEKSAVQRAEDLLKQLF